jgi:hypothetical protein
VDDDGLPSLTIADVSVDEGNSGTVNAIFAITLSPADTQEVTVNFATANGTALDGNDYTSTGGTVTFTPGETTQTITVTVSGDVLDEGDSETFSANLSNPINANLVDASADGTIVDDDTSTVSIENSPPILEGNSGATLLTFTVTLSLPTSFPVTVDYYSQSGVGGTFATPGVDYEDTSGTFTFAPGETEKTFTVTIYGDLDEETDENFSVYLINASPISIYAGGAGGYILDDDGFENVFLPIIVR